MRRQVPKPALLSLATEDSNCIFLNSISTKQPISWVPPAQQRLVKPAIPNWQMWSF